MVSTGLNVYTTSGPSRATSYVEVRKLRMLPLPGFTGFQSTVCRMTPFTPRALDSSTACGKEDLQARPATEGTTEGHIRSRR